MKFVVFVFLTFFTLHTQAQTIRYVKQNGTGNGSSWTNASNDLQAMINASAANDEIWVAEGTYYPTGNQNGTDRNVTFLIPQGGGIRIYGGYPDAGGTRDVSANPTILSGDIGTPNDSSDNSYHVMVMTNMSAAADSVVIDGFTIRDGNANGTGEPYLYNGNLTNQNEGGGILLRQNHNLSKIVIQNCTITGNVSSNNAGGFYMWETSPTVINSVITNNIAGTSGGGVFMYGAPKPQFINSVFSSNSAANGGGLFSSDVVSLPKITNCTFSDNTASGNGASIYNTNSSTVTIANSILWSGNAAKNIYNNATLNIAYSDVQQASGTYTGTGNINADPSLVSSTDFHLQDSSPCINMGNNAAIPADITTDIEGNARVQQSKVDMGAYETSYCFSSVIYVDGSVAVSGTGATWATAFKSLSAAISYAAQCSSINTILVAKGTYQPANGGSFALLPNVKMYGGYPNGGGIRNYATNITILKGNGRSVISNNNNGVTNTTVIDGFTITGGSASKGGGMYLYRSSPTIANCTFSGNTTLSGSDSFGGGIYIFNLSSPIIINCIFSGNNANTGGGGISISAGVSATITNCLFINNTSSGGTIGTGGGLQVESPGGTVTLTNCVFSGNVAAGTTDDGGGAIMIYAGTVNAVNVTFYNNTTASTVKPNGGTINVFPYSTAAILNLKNSIVWGNATQQIYLDTSPNNSSLVGIANYTNSLVKGVTAPGVINADPLFTDAAGGNYNLTLNSPAVNTGNNAAYTTAGGNLNTDTDLEGNPRLFNGTIDMGAYENNQSITPDDGNIIYVDINVPGGNGTGNSWANAVKHLADALKWARQQNNFTSDNPLKIYVAKGTYKPMFNADDASYTMDSGRKNAFVMVNNVQLYGGFAPLTGIDDITDTRIFGTGGTILSGDFNDNDVVSGTSDTRSISNNGENAYHVVIVSGADAATSTLDGFTIKGGNADDINGSITVNSNTISQSYGSGIFVSNTNGVVFNISNCTISTNKGLVCGGGMYVGFSAATITNCVFSTNIAIRPSNGGGAIYNSYSALTITGCIFSGNSVPGVLYDDAYYDGGAIANIGPSASSKLINCVFTDNYAPYFGGCIYNKQGSSSVINCTFYDNNAGGGSVIMNEYGASANVENSIVYNNGSISQNSMLYYNSGIAPTVKYSIVQGGYSGGTNIINAEPQFLNAANPVGSDGIWGTADDGLALLTGSPAVNAGNNDSIPEGIIADIAGNSRISDFIVDMGAYEYQGLEGVIWTTSDNWLNGIEPDAGKNVFIQGDLQVGTDYGSFSAKTLTVEEGGSIAINEGNSVTINGEVINYSGGENFIVESNGNLIQVENVENEGAITVRRNSSPMMRLDYAIWSSPVDGQGIHDFSPETVTSRIYTYEGANGYQLVPDLESDFIAGKGYMFRAPNNWNLTTDANGGNPVAYPGEFKGVPFNGDIVVEIHPQSFTSTGNPYPSNMKLGDNPSNPENNTFLNANPEVSAIYFWTNTYGADGSGGYTGNNWATYTFLGGTSAGLGAGTITPTAFISPGQGFIIQSTGTANTVSFNNSMRTSEEALFFKEEEEEISRFWLNLKGINSENYNQILIGYMDGATDGIDHQIDGKMFGYEGSAIYNLVNEEKFTIQGRAVPFEMTDVVPLGFRAETEDKYVISLTGKEGLFSSDEVIIYIKDKALNIIHNLEESDYIFESAAGEFKDRFEIVYQEEDTMGMDELSTNAIQIYKDKDYIVIDARTEKILSVELYDLGGRNLYKDEKVNACYYRVQSASKGVIIVKVRAKNGEIMTKKVFNN